MKPDKPSSKERIEHILSAIRLIGAFTDGFTFEDFKNDEKTYSACLYQYTIIGEASVNIEDEILRKYDYPCYKVKSFRNFILHKYHAIDERVVWDTTRIVLPGLQQVLQKILNNEF